MAALLLVASALGVSGALLERDAVLASTPGLSAATLNALVANTLVGAAGVALLAFARLRAALWLVLFALALELALETWVGVTPLHLARIPVAAALVALTARAAWPALR